MYIYIYLHYPAKHGADFLRAYYFYNVCFSSYFSTIFAGFARDEKKNPKKMEKKRERIFNDDSNYR